jgi:hypothetical protein
MLGTVDETEVDVRLGELILYVAERTQGDPSLGSARLNKYLYFVDFSAIRRLGHPITGAEYQKLKHGPAPRLLVPVRDRLIAERAARLEYRTDVFGHVDNHLVAKRTARTDLFTRDEAVVIDSVIDALRSLTSTEVSELLQAEAGWQMVAEGDTIPFELAIVVPPDRVVITPKMRARAEELLVQYADRLA